MWNACLFNFSHHYYNRIVKEKVRFTAIKIWIKIFDFCQKFERNSDHLFCLKVNDLELILWEFNKLKNKTHETRTSTHRHACMRTCFLSKCLDGTFGFISGRNQFWGNAWNWIACLGWSSSLSWAESKSQYLAQGWNGSHSLNRTWSWGWSRSRGRDLGRTWC